MNPAGGRAVGGAVGDAVGWRIGKPRAISSCEIAATPSSFARWSSAPSTESSWSFGRRPMVARALKSGHAPAFDGACDNDESLTFLGQPAASPNRRQDGLGVVTVYHYSGPPEGFGLGLQMRPVRRARHKDSFPPILAVQQ